MSTHSIYSDSKTSPVNSEHLFIVVYYVSSGFGVGLRLSVVVKGVSWLGKCFWIAWGIVRWRAGEFPGTDKLIKERVISQVLSFSKRKASVITNVYVHQLYRDVLKLHVSSSQPLSEVTITVH